MATLTEGPLVSDTPPETCDVMAVFKRPAETDAGYEFVTLAGDANHIERYKRKGFEFMGYKAVE